MATDTTSKAPGSGRRHPNDARQAAPPGRPGRASTLTEPATDLAPTQSAAAATVDWVPPDSASTIPCPTEPAPPLPPEFDRVIADRYCLVREIGRGGFGVVYLAYDRDLHRQVAVKIASCDDGHGVDYLLEEGRKAALLDHQNIVPVYDCGRTNDRTIFIVSKYIDGGSLSRLLALRKLQVDEVVRIAGQVADALSHAHENGLIHRDLKPSNILIDSSDRVYVADFGLALRTTDRSDRRCVEGSPLYMSPEQAGGKSRLVDRRTDVFSFGVLLYEMLTGKRPFPSGRDGHDHRDLEPPAPHEVCPEVPERLAQICLKAMSRDPALRHASAWELSRDLKDWEAGRSRRRPRIGLLLAATGLLLAAVLAWTLGPLAAKALSHARPGAATVSLDGEVATWALARGGHIDVEDHYPARITRVDQLPGGPFTIKAISLLNNRSVRDEDVKKLAGLKNLHYLHLSGTRITDDCGPDLARLGGLRYLWVGWNDFGDRGLLQLGGLKDLEHLNLERTDVTDLGVSAAVGAPRLDYLDLSETRVTDAGLARLHSLTRLRHIRLNRTAVTDACVEHLMKIKSLRRLEVAETEISDSAVQRLRTGLPGCLVVR